MKIYEVQHTDDTIDPIALLNADPKDLDNLLYFSGYDQHHIKVNGASFVMNNGQWTAQKATEEFQAKWEADSKKIWKYDSKKIYICEHKNTTTKQLLTSNYCVCDDCGEEV